MPLPDAISMLGSDLTTLTFSWKIVRRDGVALGFTSHDKDLYIDGLLFRSAPGVTPSAVMLSDGLDVDTMELSGAISAEAISDEDLEIGRFDGASVTFLMTDWSRPEEVSRILARGTVGQITSRDQGFVAELRSPSQALEAVAIELFSPECRADLGDTRCRVNLASYSRMCRVQTPVDISHTDLTLSEELGSDNFYGYGSARPVSGRNAGLVRQVVRSEGNLVTLRSPFPYTLDAGTLIVLRAGCDKLFKTCIEKFDNAKNFRGEPHVPGNDTVLQYSGL